MPIPQPRAGDARRPLLDLFPEVPVGTLRPPGPMFGTASGPQIPVTKPVVAHAEPAPPPDEAPPPYVAFYGLHEPPFGPAADPKFFYHSAPHDRVAQELLTAIRRREACVLVTGEPGVGKTTVCRAVVDQLDRRTLTSLLLEPCGSIEEVLRKVLVDFGVMSRDAARTPETREKLTATLASFLASLSPLQASAVIILDEAHDVPTEVLAALPTLAVAGALQVVLVGRPRLAKRLRRSELRALNQRVTVRCHLDPLPVDEILGYLMRRLAVAGASPRVAFDDAAVARIYELTGGVPRAVNLLCDRALVRGYETSARVIDGPLVDAAAEMLELEAPVAESRSAGRTFLAVLGFVLFVLVGASGAMWVFRDSVTRAVAQWAHVPATPSAPAPRLPAPLPPILPPKP